MVTKRANPRNAQLGDRDALTTRYGRQRVDELEIMPDILEPVATSGRNSGAQDVKKRALTSSWKRLNERLKSPSSKSIRLLKWPVSNPCPSGLFGVRRKRIQRKDCVRICYGSYAKFFARCDYLTRNMVEL